MQQDSSIPHALSQYLWPAAATILAILGWVGGWFSRRKREPIELAHLKAQTRQINISTDVQLITAVSEAIGKVERVQDERDHWERKALDSMTEAATLAHENAQQGTRLTHHENEIKKLKALLDINNIPYSDADKFRPKDK
jgi:hypothetical protein